MKLHHVQVACPPGGEDVARKFYGDGLGLTEIDKPAALKGRGGAWFRARNASGEVDAEIHVGVEGPFAPARKAHPALVLNDVPALDELGERLSSLGFDVDWRERYSFDGYERLHTRDGHGNRVEILASL
ncbi:glyoxalase [Arthrobacter roseus]|uniref:glyoxalase n=1 Tax=Arthrobacter roseus TaxID=136274 RepID=UPI0019662E52|nr:glyoxalase [Arthrobacter roseus]MBM7847539.1 catechol 2,3-dioxygenase-like lactoylglutathione lyase family enzyme [Arthrobacter roseus]